MNNQALNELKVVVEQTVRPIRASFARKRRTREELLAHLSAIFEQELEKLGDDRAALDQSKRRFGEPSELTAQFQTSVPFWDRTRYYLEKCSYQPGESIPRCTIKLVLTLTLCYSVLLLLLILKIPSHGSQNELKLVIHISFAGWALTIVLIPSFFILVERLARDFFLESSERLLYMKVFYCLLCILFCPVFAFLDYWMINGDFAESLLRLRFGCYLAPAALLLFILIARQVADEIRYKRQWTSLKIDD